MGSSPTTSADRNSRPRLTASGRSDGENRAWSDLEHIAQVLEDAFPNLVTLAAIGAFGRGEGAMVISDRGISPWNDYDLLLVTPDRQGWERLGALCHDLKDRLHLPGLDVVPFIPGDLRRAADAMLVVDARACHVILRGTAAPLTMLPVRTVADREVVTLLLNRMVCLLECPPKELCGKDPDPVRFPSQVSKALLAVVDAVLVDEGVYVVPYREKVARFVTRTRDHALLRAVDLALSFRMQPGPRDWGADIWQLARTQLLATVAHWLGCPSATADDLAGRLWRLRFPPATGVLRALLRGHLPDVRRRAVECAEVLILGAAAGGTNDSLIRTAVGYLHKAGPCTLPTTWAEAAGEAVRLWFEVSYG